MKKLTLVVAFLILSTTLVFADLEFSGTSFTGGYSSASNNGFMGFNADYLCSFDITNNFLMGFMSHADIMFVFGKHNPGIGVGVIVGPVITIAADISNTINISFGPGMYTENSFNPFSFLGMGVGIDASYTHTFNGGRGVGLTIGATSYLMFFNNVVDNSGIPTYIDFASTVMGYIGVKWKFGNTKSNGTYILYF